MPAYLTEDELDQLIRSRLLRLEDRYGAQRIELTHDVLTGVVREHRDLRRAEEKVAEQAEQERHARPAPPSSARPNSIASGSRNGSGDSNPSESGDSNPSVRAGD